MSGGDLSAERSMRRVLLRAFWMLFALACLAQTAAAQQAITTIAGNGTKGFSGDGGPATSAELAAPEGMAMDAAGNLYFVDVQNFRVRKISSSGTISTVAGTGTRGSSGDGGPATSAAMVPFSVAVDSAGNLYITDIARIRKVTPSGTISTVAGTGRGGFSGDGGPATSAQIFAPEGVAVDTAGNIYIADTDNHRIRKVTPAGTITTVAGNGTKGFSGDGGPATGASLNDPTRVTVDAQGNLYIADEQNNRVRKVTAAGVISTLAGTGIGGYSGDGGPATSAMLFTPYDVAVDAAGNVYIADSQNNRIREVTPDGKINTVAGNGPKPSPETAVPPPVRRSTRLWGSSWTKRQTSTLPTPVTSGSARRRVRALTTESLWSRRACCLSALMSSAAQSRRHRCFRSPALTPPALLS